VIIKKWGSRVLKSTYCGIISVPYTKMKEVVTPTPILVGDTSIGMHQLVWKDGEHSIQKFISDTRDQGGVEVE
jgi:hypothetical protein